MKAVIMDIFSRGSLGPYLLPNRIVMAPMTRNRAGKDRVPTALNATYYAQRASAGFIVTEATQISPQGIGYPATPGIHSQEQVVGWRQVTQAVHAKGGRIFLQLWHVGRISHPSMQPGGVLPVAPSAIRPEGEASTVDGRKPFVTPRALELAEIPSIVDDYRRAAKNARAAGFDGVELHGANGYLLDQFLRDKTNRRSDRYGGSIANRARLLLEVVEAVAEVWGRNLVGVRLSPSSPFNDMGDSEPEATFGYVIKELDRLGLGYLHIVETGTNNTGANGVRLDAAHFRRIYGGLLIANGGYDRARADAVIGQGCADLVSFGALFLANPDLPERLRAKGPFNPPDRATFYGGGDKGYADYPALGQQLAGV
jgi:N-ethylmaleimide reductase